LLYRQLGGGLFPGDYIVGDMLIVGNPDDDGDDTDVPASVRDFIRNSLSKANA
jgi:hypothetical protein